MTTNTEWKALGKVWIRGPYLVTVDYTKSIEDMVENWEKARGFNWASHEITSRNFPISGAGVVEVEIVLIYFGREVKYEEVIKEMEQMDLRPALLPELLALGTKYDSLPYRYSIFALGSIYEDGKDRSSFHTLEVTGVTKESLPIASEVSQLFTTQNLRGTSTGCLLPSTNKSGISQALIAHLA